MTSPRPVPVALTALLAAITLTGCLSIHDPASTPPTTTTSTTAAASSSTTVTDADPAPERGGSITPAARATQTQLGAGAAQPTPAQALQRYASLWINWTAATLVARQHQLARLSVGQARAQALQAAASFAHDRTLAASHVANHGEVIAITPSLITAGRWVVVSTETTTGHGDYADLPATLHVTYAAVTPTRHGFVVSTWSPAN